MQSRNPFRLFSAAGMVALLCVMGVMTLGLTGCDAKPPRLLILAGSTMGTYYAVKVAGADRETGAGGVDAQRLEHGMEGILAQIDASMSTYRKDSELSGFNAHGGADWFPVSEDLYTVVSQALRVSRLTDGAFDITVGPLVNLWGFGPPGDESGSRARGASTTLPPHAADVQNAMARTGYEKIGARATPPALRKDDPGLYLDLSAIAKGFAVDKLAEYLTEQGFSHYLVDIGGELRAKGEKAVGKPWRIAIEEPAPGNRTARRIIDVHDRAVATSGDYRNFFEEDGKRYAHIIDPRTGRPVTHKLVSVTVIAPSAMQADAMATAISVLGPQAGYRLAAREKLPVWLVTKTETGFADRHTPGFAEFIVK